MDSFLDIQRIKKILRNRVIVRLFNEANKIEQWGKGIQRTFALCKEKVLKEPVVNEIGLFIKFVFYRKQDAKQGITKSEEIIMEHFEKYETVKTTETMQFFGLFKPRTSAILVYDFIIVKINHKKEYIKFQNNY